MNLGKPLKFPARKTPARLHPDMIILSDDHQAVDQAGAHSDLARVHRLGHFFFFSYKSLGMGTNGKLSPSGTEEL